MVFSPSNTPTHAYTPTPTPTPPLSKLPFLYSLLSAPGCHSPCATNQMPPSPHLRVHGVESRPWLAHVSSQNKKTNSTSIKGSPSQGPHTPLIAPLWAVGWTNQIKPPCPVQSNTVTPSPTTSTIPLLSSLCFRNFDEGEKW